MATTTWTYNSQFREGADSLIDYDVEATDGRIGKVVEESLEVDASHLVVDTGFWIFGTKRLIPAGVVTGVDHADKTIHIDMNKEQVKDSPAYEPHDTQQMDVDAYRRPYVDYYAGWPWL